MQDFLGKGLIFWPSRSAWLSRLGRLEPPARRRDACRPCAAICASSRKFLGRHLGAGGGSRQPLAASPPMDCCRFPRRRRRPDRGGRSLMRQLRGVIGAAIARQLSAGAAFGDAAAFLRRAGPVAPPKRFPRPIRCGKDAPRPPPRPRAGPAHPRALDSFAGDQPPCSALLLLSGAAQFPRRSASAPGDCAVGRSADFILVNGEGRQAARPCRLIVAA